MVLIIDCRGLNFDEHIFYLFIYSLKKTKMLMLNALTSTVKVCLLCLMKSLPNYLKKVRVVV